jgi:hypothetical protein
MRFWCQRFAVFTQHGSEAACCERQLLADSVEKVGHGFFGGKVRV